METLLKLFLSSFFRFSSKLSPKLTAKVAWSFFCKPRIRKKPLSDFENKLLQKSTQFYIESEHYKIAVYQWNNTEHPQQARTVLLSHGWGGHALNFGFIINKLVEGGFNVIAYDSPAHGKSSGQQTNLLHNTRALLKVCEHIPPIHALIGHSFGSMASAFAFDLSRSSTTLANLDKIILIASPNKLADIFASFTQAMGLSANVLAIFHRKLEVVVKRDIESMTTVKFLQDYNKETLVIHDYNDRIVPFAEAETIANELASASLFATTNCGHFRILAAKNTLNMIFDFISNNPDSK